jgi:hypothetical protein
MKNFNKYFLGQVIGISLVVDKTITGKKYAVSGASTNWRMASSLIL